ncbi:MAG TPA: diiron oxygenase [Actinocrinis sp.]|nr:diiron oxygenase [Actinocrinis sp.]HEV2343025.1 diiron oxygenase [Actinocrinis sp.]
MSQWSVPLGGSMTFTWEYDRAHDDLLRLYRLGKERQWNAETRIDWAHEVDPDNPLGMPDEFIWIAGTPLWDGLDAKERSTVRVHTAGWLYSQFLHGEQAALMCAAKIVQTVPDLDAKFYAATQVMDEARHTEAYQRFLNTKIGVTYPISDALGALLATIATDPRWDITALGMQVLVEGLALASFSIQRDRMRDPLARAFNAYVLQDEARHVAFGRVALRRFYAELTEAELREREQFAIEACWALRDRFVGEEMWRRLDLGAEECIRLSRRSPAMREFRRRLFSRIVPTLRDINLFGPSMQAAFEQMGVLGFSRLDIGAVGDEDERAAAEFDRRRAEVSGFIDRGAQPPEESP